MNLLVLFVVGVVVLVLVILALSAIRFPCAGYVGHAFSDQTLIANSPAKQVALRNDTLL